MGEALSARVSYYELAVDKAERIKVKSSGLCVSTGTGSTSWTFNINKLTQQNVSDLMRLIQEETNTPINQDRRLVDKITATFNDHLIFGPGSIPFDFQVVVNVFIHLNYIIASKSFFCFFSFS